MVGTTNLCGRFSPFIRMEPLLFIEVVLQLSSRGSVNPVPDPLLLIKCGSIGNRTWDLWICSQALSSLGHRHGQSVFFP
jgi:hypothetical protein